jgi:Flp pilus assembly protein TadD
MLGEAIGHFEEAARLAPDDPAVHTDLGALYSDGGMAEEAVRSFEAALKVDPGYAPALENLERARDAAGGGR